MKINVFNEFKDSVYMAYDVISHYPIFFFVARSDSEAVRKAMLSLRVPLRDSCLYELGSFRVDLNFANFSALKKLRHVPWSSYKLPENMAESLAPLGCSSEEIQEIIKNSVSNKSEVTNE